MVSRGDVWLVLPDIGAGTPAAHPCVILSPPEIHDHLGVVIVAPLAEARTTGFRVPTGVAGQPGTICLEQIHAIEIRQLTRQVGEVGGKTLAAALGVLREMFAE